MYIYIIYVYCPPPQSDKDTVNAYIDLALNMRGGSWSLPILRNSSVTSNMDLQKSFTDALVQLKVKEITAQVTRVDAVCVSVMQLELL